jgi:hypothetical protein
MKNADDRFESHLFPLLGKEAVRKLFTKENALK